MAVAQILSKKHGDRWLLDLMDGDHSVAWWNGVREVSAAAAANAVGDVTALRSHAEQARLYFETDGNRAGQAIASVEYLKGLNRSELGDRCMPAALAALGANQDSGYRWIEANLLLESSTCSGSRGEPEQQSAYARRAAAIADTARYENVRLETLFYLDGVTAPWVASNGSWDAIRAGLAEFWHTSSPAAFWGEFLFRHDL